MQIQFKQWMLLAPWLLLAPAFSMAQPLNMQGDASSTLAPAAVPVDPAQQAAIKDLLAAIDADKHATAIGNSAQMQMKQLVPAILSDALSENKKLTDAQKRAAVPQLRQNALAKLAEQAGQPFTTAQFHQDALQAQRDAYAKYYTADEIKDLTKFYKSKAGSKFLQVQDQVGGYVLNSLMQKYMPPSVQATREQADKEIELVAKARAPQKPANKANNPAK
ncbi:MAG: hypothetical protein ON057_001341 [Glomeribacter sp. 1016415]|nr:hypothetical protein [Glomeribacter sp. 1016415]